MTTEYVTLSKSQKALSDIINMAKAIIAGEQETFNNLPASTDKAELLDMCVKFDGAIGKFDKLTITAISKSVKSAYERLIKGDSRKASSKYEKEVAMLKASLILGTPASELLKKQDERANNALYRKNLILSDKSLQALQAAPVVEDETETTDEIEETEADEETTDSE